MFCRLGIIISCPNYPSLAMVTDMSSSVILARPDSKKVTIQPSNAREPGFYTKHTKSSLGVEPKTPHAKQVRYI